jgi:hypothetical protein
MFSLSTVQWHPDVLCALTRSQKRRCKIVGPTLNRLELHGLLNRSSHVKEQPVQTTGCKSSGYKRNGR